MRSYDEWYEAISSGDPVKKRILMHERMNKMRASSKLSPEDTEEVLSIYERASLRNFEIGERNRKEYAEQKRLISEYRMQQIRWIMDSIIFVAAILFTVLAIMASY